MTTMNAELIRIANKVADSWQGTDAYHQASEIIKMLINECKNQDKQYREAKETIEFIMGSQKFCALCSNLACKNSTTGEVGCEPMWSGRAPWRLV